MKKFRNLLMTGCFAILLASCGAENGQVLNEQEQRLIDSLRKSNLSPEEAIGLIQDKNNCYLNCNLGPENDSNRITKALFDTMIQNYSQSMPNPNETKSVSFATAELENYIYYMKKRMYQDGNKICAGITFYFCKHSSTPTRPEGSNTLALVPYYLDEHNVMKSWFDVTAAVSPIENHGLECPDRCAY